ncbi:MAG: glycogen debranching protein [Oscillochloris sp.]|nr:glycogen debranching protein [Oscillochloris sp.]
MPIEIGRALCGDLPIVSSREWLVTNGLGSFASGTIAGQLTRRYHGILVAALSPPLGRTLLVARIDDTAHYNGHAYPLFSNCWSNHLITPDSYTNLERWHLEGTIPVWSFTCADALIERRIWMQPGANTTYVRYTLCRATLPLMLTIKALVNYRDYHSTTRANGWRMQVDPIACGVCVSAYAGARSFSIAADRGAAQPNNEWYYGYELAEERARGLDSSEDHLCAALFEVTLQPGEALTLVASCEEQPDMDGAAALATRQAYEQDLLRRWATAQPTVAAQAPDWVRQLVLAADQFVVDRPLPGDPQGKTIIAGYHWFADWGRDTMISLPGLTLASGRPEVARSIVRTFARYLSRGMLPNRFPDDGSAPQDSEYNTVDATLWYVQAIRAYHQATGDDELLRELFPKLAEIIVWHSQGTRYNIRRDPTDGLLAAGELGVQLTWMDAKVGDWVVTPRRGKPVEINALWYNALRAMAEFADRLGQPAHEYTDLAEQAGRSFARFWNTAAGYCYDVIDGPDGPDAALRPNQIFAVALPDSPLSAEQQRAVVEACARALLTSHGLRSLAPDHPQYQGRYGGDQTRRDGAYHQGTVWAWLLGPFALAHLRVFNDPAQARRLLEPLGLHLGAAGMGSISEIFDGDTPLTARGCIAQAWSVAEILRAWSALA